MSHNSFRTAATTLLGAAMFALSLPCAHAEEGMLGRAWDNTRQGTEHAWNKTKEGTENAAHDVGRWGQNTFSDDKK